LGENLRLRIPYTTLRSRYPFERNTALMYAIGKLFIDVIVVLFFVGMAGSAVVVLISFIEDFRELFGDDDVVPEPVSHAPARTSPSAASFSYDGGKTKINL